MSQYIKFYDGTPLPDIETLTGNSGGAVGPTGGNINVVGDGTTIDITGNPGTSTLTASFIGTTDITITGDTGGAQTGNSFTFNGGTTGLSFGGAADVFTTTFAGITANGGTVSLATDATASTINVGTGAGAKTSMFGSSNTTSSTTLQSGSGALNVTSTNGALSINSGTGALSISNDASATTVNIASGAAAKTVQLGSTNTTSSLALRYGTSDFTLASATGTVMSALDTGEITFPLQPAFLATHTADQLNITGNGAVATVNYTTEVFDQNGDYDGTNTFTAPVTGRYYLNGSVALTAVGGGTNGNVRIVTSNRSYISPLLSYAAAVSGPGVITFNGNALCDMDIGDTATFAVTLTGVGANTSDVLGDATQNWFSGFLAC